jgi:hypothetical protein
VASSFLRRHASGQNLCLQFVYTAIANQQLVGNKVICTMVSLDIFVVNTIRLKKLLSNEIITIDYTKSKDNIAHPLGKGLSGKQVNCLSRGMNLKPII